ncbi:hypothetical protein PFICI_11233 [Pestalotiopsis fici W106-1]|uniref:Heterokaryon incompatibility domain-containing protein n=1 Tax=Pestalotiopsis fici (strain W106-1 / CGMCC3.15140) TaxID=1229662 RepID=W3WU91_PESFW|nr:uncharacterized protein PFICI_11233 [Pestalotiopsis fici W106-1]ETS77359.1 hypothetical protein PFICI_11233 [Pestalotiopsis fici W106-1]
MQLEYTRCFPPAASDFPDSQLATLAESWVRDCLQNHAECTLAKKDFRPKRLVQILNKDFGRLVLPRELPPKKKIDYVAVSHCWGDPRLLKKLTVDNEHELQDKIKVADLPATFKEAISACWKLGFRFIWIDSLCIMQGDQADWQEQASEMGSVYGNAVLSLCMAGSANSAEPSLQSRNTDLTLPLCITLTGGNGEKTTLRLVCNRSFEDDIKACPLRKRAWVFQEWYLAKRSLIFGRMQLWWHCCEKLACETFPDGISGSIAFKSAIGITDAETMKGKVSKTLQSPQFAQKLWWDLIKQYAKTKLTKEAEDRVIAFSGISKMFGEFHNIESQYTAGMWRCHLPRALLWYRYCGGETFRSLDYKAPSWSWMSLDGPITLEDDSDGQSPTTPLIAPHYCCSVDTVYLPLEDKSNATGRLQGGSVRISGHLLELTERDEDTLPNHISLKHFGESSGMEEIRWDEEDDKGNKIVSYLDNVVMELCQGGDITGCSRTRVALEQATGSFFALPIIHQTDDDNLAEVIVAGLVLYQPPHLPDIFYRVASYQVPSDSEWDFTAFSDRLHAHFPRRSIFIL